MIALLVLIVCVCLAGAYVYHEFFAAKPAEHRNITDLQSAYNADTEIAQALDKYKASQEKATVITHDSGRQRVVALTFDGLSDRTTVQRILDLLKKHDIKATFFVDGVQTAEDPQTVVNIRTEGHKIENYTLSGVVKMERLPGEVLIKDFCRAQKIIRVTVDKWPNLLKCNDTAYTDDVLRAAKASGFESVIKSDVVVDTKMVNSPKAADDFVSANVKPGYVVSVKLKTNIDPIVNEPGKTDLRPAIDKQPGLKQLSQQADTGEKELIDAVDRLLGALKKANYASAYVETFPKTRPVPVTTPAATPKKTTFRETILDKLISAAMFVREQFTALFACRTAFAAEFTENNMAKELKFIPTSEQAIAYTFGGLTNEKAVNDVLARLKRLGIKGTFFVMEVEMRRYPEIVRKIIANGHEIGLGIRPRDGETAEETGKAIARGRKLLQDQFGVTTNLIKQPWAAVTDTTREAIAAAGCVLIGQSMNVVQTKHKDYTSADQIMPEIFGKSVFSLSRGQIIHFRLDFYTNERLVGDLMETIKSRKIDNIAYATSFDSPAYNMDNDSQYRIKPVGKILANANAVYQFPVDQQNVPAEVTRGPRLTIDRNNFLAEVSNRYIGNYQVDFEDRMLGFTKMEARRLDTTGYIHTEKNIIFLTFDDWGTDASVNKILYVLRKHKVPATFFVLTNNVLLNPNLVRSMALQGHEIGSHSDKHKPMAARDPKTNRQFESYTKEEYIKEYATSYQKLREIVGDVTINGKPALTRYFRPPQLAISRTGFEALFDTGFEFFVNGSCESYDYKAKNYAELVDFIKDGLYTKHGELQKGAVLVMHMGDPDIYTAVALDILLTANEAKEDSDPSKFQVARLSDYLKDGYSQINKKKTLRLFGDQEKAKE